MPGDLPQKNNCILLECCLICRVAYFKFGNSQTLSQFGLIFCIFSTPRNSYKNSTNTPKTYKKNLVNYVLSWCIVLSCIHHYLLFAICSELRYTFAGLKVVLSGTQPPKVLPVRRDYKPVSLLRTCCQTSY